MEAGGRGLQSVVPNQQYHHHLGMQILGLFPEDPLTQNLPVVLKMLKSESHWPVCVGLWGRQVELCREGDT